MSLTEAPGEREEKGVMETIVVGAIVGLALVFLTKNLYNVPADNSACCCKGKLCSKKRKMET